MVIPLLLRRSEPVRHPHPALRLLGGASLAAGLGLFGWTVALFARRGRGTLAPWDPPEHLVVEGPYRHVRNPMISGVILALFGQAALFASPRTLGWAALFALSNAAYQPLREEPDLEARFGDAYRRYRRHVPRWLPRLSPWAGPQEEARREVA